MNGPAGSSPDMSLAGSFSGACGGVAAVSVFHSAVSEDRENSPVRIGCEYGMSGSDTGGGGGISASLMRASASDSISTDVAPASASEVSYLGRLYSAVRY